MSYTPLDDRLVYQYLLGELSPEEQRRLEERLLSDPASVEQLLIVEEDLIDSYVSGELSPRERERFEYLFSTSQRKRKLRLARALRRYVEQNSSKLELKPRRRLVAKLKYGAAQPAWAAAVLLLIIVAAAWWLFSPSAVSQGIAALNAAYHQQRPLESRITGLVYAPWTSTRDGGEIKFDYVARDRAANLLIGAALEHPGPATRHALGRLYLTNREFDKAIQQMEEALKAEPSNAQLHSDLGAAYLELGWSEREGSVSGQNLEALAKSREHLEEAVRLDGNLLAAMFNRGLWRQRQRLWSQAEESWRKYLERDSTSPWAEEARRYLSAVVEERRKQISQTKEEALKEYLAAWQARDHERAWRVISRSREAITGKLIWWQLAETFIKAAVNGQMGQADHLLQAISFAGKLDLQRADDPFTARLADFYHRSSARQKMTLAQAHELMDRGHALYLQAQYPDAIDRYTQSKRLFEQAGDRWEAKLAEFFIDYSYFQSGRVGESRALFARLAESCEREGHRWLLIQVYNSLGSVCFAQADYSAGNRFTGQALAAAERITDHYAIQKNLAQLATHYKYLDDFSQSLAYLRRCQEVSGDWWPGVRQMWRTYTTLAQVFNARRSYAAAADYQYESLRLALSAPDEFKDPSLVYYSYANLGLIYGKLQDRAAALDFAQRGYDTARALPPHPGRTKMLAYASLHLGHLRRQFGDTNGALVDYQQAIEQYQAVDDQVRIYDAHKGRLLCYLARGENTQAQAELRAVLDFAEKYRAGIEEERHRNTFFDAEQDVYDLAIDFEYSRRGDAQAAFDYSERARARSLLGMLRSGGEAHQRMNHVAAAAQPCPLKELREQMPERTRILQYAMLNDRLLIWVVSRRQFATVEQKISLDALEEKVLRYWSLISRPPKDEESKAAMRREAIELYEWLIAPVASLGLLDGNDTICIVPDKVLSYLPFGALLAPASGRYLIEDYRLLSAPSANTFLLCSERARQRGGQNGEILLSVGGPNFDRQKFPLPPLPDAAREAQVVAQYYPDSSLLLGEDAGEAKVRSEMGRASVIHLASHYVVDERFPWLSKLLLAKEPGDALTLQAADGVLQAEEIYQQPLSLSRLVVLSACRSGVERYYRGEGMVGMSRTFLAAGVPLVVASLWPVDSAATARLMINFHRFRKQGGYPTTEALRRAQSEMISESPYYWAAFITVGGYADY